MGGALPNRVTRRRQLEAELRAAVDRALAEGPAGVEAPRSAGGERQRLRHLPVIGAVGGAIPGTRPDTAVLGRRRRR